MGITAMIPDMTIGQLINEAEPRWGEIWDDKAARMLVLLMCPRKERKLMELHGDMVEHGQPVMTVFHRPRKEAPLLEQQNFDPKAASFQFVNLASPDLGPWLQHLISNEKWLRGSVELSSVPFSMDMPAQRPFESERILCFRHPSLPALERYYLPFPPTSIPGKCFVSLPRRQAAELARQQAEVLGVGRLEKKQTITQMEASELPPTPAAQSSESNMDAVMNDFSSNMLSGMTDVEEMEQSVALPVTAQTDVSVVEDEPEHVFVPLPPGTENSNPSSQQPQQNPLPSDDVETSEPSQNVPVPEPLPEPEPEMSDIEREFRELVTGLLAAGIEPSEVMDDPRWEDISERAAAEGFETWPVFLQLAAM
jgi:hypothetical protein